MNIFLDTNILYQDPFFRSQLSKLLLQSQAAKKVNIIIPQVCLNELFFRLEDKLKGLSSDIKIKIEEVNRLIQNETNTFEIDIESFEKEIQEFYNSKIRNSVFFKIKNKPEYYDESLSKAIRRFNPFFTEKKEEFRDSLIWCSIRDYAANKRNEKNYFVTNNYNDFWNSDKNNLHPNLQLECDNIIIIESLKKLFEVETSLINFKTAKEFENWISTQNINSKSIQSAVDKYLWKHIVGGIEKAIKEYPTGNVKESIEIGFIIPVLEKENYTILKIEKTEIFDSFALLTVTSELKFQGKLYYPNSDKGDFSNYESLSFKSIITLVLSFNKDLIFTPSTVELMSIEVE